ncbi:M23/M56 family metallopeptidase [Simiduia curdlanivorans]|uniref:M23/M56 family metallopeptidase n=1 Tax=Simiduia curdlanivorans TaxID=1492769 RepID=A0ABV8UZI3_9GAMM|nr:M23/M56 family metallopeptidase [Simiduia curdlanivorans]MDN3640365.1 M23/M56 family metallopeptidase [Simiduia curdlanivorans]
MNELSSLFIPFFWCCVVFIGFSGLVFGLAQLAEKCWPNSPQWRSLWLPAVGICWLPLVLFFLPAFPPSEAIIVLPPLLEAGPGGLVGVAGETGLSSSMSSVTLLVWLLLLGFVVGAMVKLAVLLLQIIGLHYQTKKAIALENYLGLPNQHRRYFERVQKKMQLELLISEQSVSPYVLGLWRPRLVLTSDVVRTLPLQALKLIVRHECTHIRRYDYAMVLLVQLSNCLAWFNPFYRSLVDRLHWSIELSCDRQVLQKRPRQNHQYAKAMVSVLSLISQCQQTQFVTFTHHQKRSVRMRITTILQPVNSYSLSMAQRLIMLCGFVTLTGVAVLAQSSAVIAAEVSPTVFQNPVPAARVSSSFGQKTDRFHNGIDLAIGTGAKVVASAGGRVLVSTDVYDNKVNYGKIIIIEHANGLRSLYSHLDSRVVAKGDTVAAGQLIGTVGETGKVTGPHLHFEILDGDNRLDPAQFIGLPTPKNLVRRSGLSAI